MSDDKKESLFDTRVDEVEVARILQLVSKPPNWREKPQPGDVSGNFDYWFDGGACRLVTGRTEFVFEDGIQANVLVIPTLSVSIEFPDGRRVEIRQTKP